MKKLIAVLAVIVLIITYIGCTKNLPEPVKPPAATVSVTITSTPTEPAATASITVTSTPTEPAPTASITVTATPTEPTATASCTPSVTQTKTPACSDNPMVGTACDGDDADLCPDGVFYCDGSDNILCSDDIASNAEVCDGIDNDCDGSTDNGLIAPACNNQQGVCAGAQKTCGGAAGWIDCNAAAYLAYNPAYESGTETLCDGKDNNCNGQTDEMSGSLRPLCAKQMGVCSGSRQTCGGVSGWQPCNDSNYLANDSNYQATESACGDGLDNDCDTADDCADGSCAGVGTCP